jgi:hypothetical protein
MKTKTRHALLPTLLILLLLAACITKPLSDISELSATSTDATASAILGQIQSTESDSVAYQSPRHFLDHLIPSAYAAACGNFITASGICSSATSIWNLSGCNSSLEPTVSFAGSWTFTFNTPQACTDAKTSGLLAMGANNQYTLTSTAGITRTRSSGIRVVTDSSPSGSVSKSGGSRTVCGSSGCGTSRTITILGIHRKILTSNLSVLSDMTFSTNTPITVTGTGSSRSVISGTVQAQDNVNNVNTSTSISSALNFSASCCFPTSGTLTTSYLSGPAIGQTETLTFQSTCGSVAITTALGTTNTTLAHCQ